uniref:Uncharacterized protein n=1 Tax=Anguilla anguilla TaxID=7936 RepID=A0A0E9WIT3_ANGAN
MTYTRRRHSELSARSAFSSQQVKKISKNIYRVLFLFCHSALILHSFAKIKS